MVPASEAISVMGPLIDSKIDVSAFLIVWAFLFLILRTQIFSVAPSVSKVLDTDVYTPASNQLPKEK